MGGGVTRLRGEEDHDASPEAWRPNPLVSIESMPPYSGVGMTPQAPAAPRVSFNPRRNIPDQAELLPHTPPTLQETAAPPRRASILISPRTTQSSSVSSRERSNSSGQRAHVVHPATATATTTNSRATVEKPLSPPREAGDAAPAERQQSDSPPPEPPAHQTRDTPPRIARMEYRPLARSVSPAQALGDYGALALSSLQSELKRNHKVLRVCLTGGPCAGKSTMLAEMQAKLPQRIGYEVYCVPEAATLLVTGGMRWDGGLVVEQQLCLLRTQLALEDQFYAAAIASGKPAVVISDRGTMDGRAFCTDEQFTAILSGLGCTMDILRDRYDAVLHMVTSAIGAESFYNLDNPARFEDLEGAKISDMRLRQMYVGHPMFRLLDNSTSFEDKIERGLRLMAEVVGQRTAPAGARRVAQFLLRRCPRTLPIASATYEVTTTILNNSQMNEMRLVVRRVMSDGSAMHFFRTMRTCNTAHQGSRSRSGSSTTTISPGYSHHSRTDDATAGALGPFRQQRVESAQRISSKEYSCLLQNRDTMREEVVCTATHCIHEGANFEITTILAPRWSAGKQTVTAEPNCSSADAEISFPPFLEVDREVPIDVSTTAFLISHSETGPLYASLAFAPMFSRTISALGSHADVEDILCSTRSSTPHVAPQLRVEKDNVEISHHSEAATDRDNTYHAATPSRAADKENGLSTLKKKVFSPLHPRSTNVPGPRGTAATKGQHKDLQLPTIRADRDSTNTTPSKQRRTKQPRATTGAQEDEHGTENVVVTEVA